MFNNKKTSGILRIDTNEKPRRLSGSSVEFKLQPELLGYEPTSPASSNYAIIASPQLSVRFANQTDQDTSDNSRVEQLSEDQSVCLSPLTKDNTREPFPSLTSPTQNTEKKRTKSPFLSAKRKKPRKNLRLSLEASDDYFYRCDKESPIYMEPISPLNLPEMGSDDDDYSVSVSAIMQRRLSTKRGSRKGKRSVASPLDVLDKKDRRRSSVYTTSSGDTAITMEETNNQDSTQEQIFENIRIHKEVLQQVKWQPWTMKRKLKLVQQAKSYIAQHEGELQERFASSRSYRDIWQRFKIVIGAWFSQKWQHTKRELANLATWLIPWELRIKEIESHFGSVVASYFTFLRWLFWVNIVIAVVLFVCLAVPELITTDVNTTDRRKKMSDEEYAVAKKLITIWEFEGYLKYSPLFYGYYTKEEYKDTYMDWYNLPLAYFLVGVAVYIYSFYATLQKMAENSRMSKLSSKDDDCTFSWKIFTGWDFMIGHTETAQNRLSSVILGFKEALLEESEKKKDARNWKIICLRIFVNLIVLSLLVVSAFAVVKVVAISEHVDQHSSWLERNAITLVLSAISFFFPMFFESLGFLEYYHPRQQLRIQLARIMVLNLLNLYSLIFALFDKIEGMSKESARLREIIEPAVVNGSEIGTVTSDMTMPTITPELAMTTITTIATILTAMMGKGHIFPNKSQVTEPPMDTTTFFDGFKTVSPFDITFDEDRNVMNTTDEENSILTTLVTDTTTTTTEIQDIEYDPSVAHYYLLTDEELELEKNRTKRLASFILNDTYTDDDNLQLMTTFDEYDSRDFTENPLNTTYVENQTDSVTTELITDPTMTSVGTTTEVMTTELVTTTKKRMMTTRPITKLFENLPTTTAVAVTERLTNQTMETLEEAQRKIRNLCWETMFGQELVKLTVMDLIITVGSTMFLDFFRALFVRYMNGCWCWDLEKQYPQYGDFKIAENILHLVNNQGMVWMGMFFSPGLALINLVKLGILMYLRSWTVLTCNVPHEVVFRASRSNNFYLALLLTMLFLCVLPVSYAIVLLTPSWHCGPFSKHEKIYFLFTKAAKELSPQFIKKSFSYLASPAAIIPLLVLLILIIYYLLSLTGSLREANHDLRNQLRKERTEERKKMWKLAEEQTKGPTNGANTLTARWKKVLEGAQSPSPENAMAGTVPDTKVDARKELLAKIMKKALRKGSASDDDSQVTNIGDETDTEAHESLPRDQSPITKTPDVKPKRKLKNPFAQIIAMAKEKATLKEVQDGVENQENKENIRKEIEGDTGQEQDETKKSPEDQEADEKERVVSERRRSLFKRQENIAASGVDTVESQQAENKPKAPDLIFKFDESLTQAGQHSEKQLDTNDSNGKKFKPEKPKRNGANVKHRCSPHHEVMSDSSSDYPATANEPKHRVETPHYAAPMKIRPVTEKPVSAGPDGKYSKKVENDNIEKKEAAEINTKPSPSKPKRKFNKFFAIEKDEKSDGTSPKSPKSPTAFVEPIPEHPTVEILPKQESLSSKDSVESSSKDSKTDNKKSTKRQDSQTSIWSDNIPVITISKTESNENILEGDSGTIKKKKTPKKTEN